MIRRVSLSLCALLAACNGPTTARGSATDDATDSGDDIASGDEATDDDPPVDVPVDVPVNPVDEVPPASRCVDDDAGARCTFETRSIVERDVHFQLPAGPAPVGGFPTVILFQGSFVSAELAFTAAPDDAYGAIHQTRLVKALLDAGYAVLAPETRLNGATYWDTNIAPYALAWTIAPDHTFMEAIFAAIDAGDFGPLDGDALFATGFSSGGYMTSRMAVSYAGRFRALAINSGSYATCSTLCFVPALPDDHAPTLFLTGAADPIVLLGTVTAYEDALRPITETELIVVDGAGHEWQPRAKTAIPAFFNSHR